MSGRTTAPGETNTTKRQEQDLKSVRTSLSIVRKSLGSVHKGRQVSRLVVRATQVFRGRTKETATIAEKTRSLLMLTVPGVQRSISEARRTTDVWAGSAIHTVLSRAALKELNAASPETTDITLVMPADTDGDCTNRIVATVPTSQVEELTARMQLAVSEAWKKICTDVLGREPSELLQAEANTVWVAAPIGNEADAELHAWNTAARALVARRRIRDFGRYVFPETETCMVSPRYKSTDISVIAKENKSIESLVRRGEHLSEYAIVKRAYRSSVTSVLNPDGEGGAGASDVVAAFPSTRSIASAPFRHDVLRLVLSEPEIANVLRDLRELTDAHSMLPSAIRSGSIYTTEGIPYLSRLLEASSTPEQTPYLQRYLQMDGTWSSPETWDAEALLKEVSPTKSRAINQQVLEKACKRGKASAKRLCDALSPPPVYYAIVMQDGDHMGKKLGGLAQDGKLFEHQREASRKLSALAREQRQIVEGDDPADPRCQQSTLRHYGRVIYAGGDDLLAMVPVVNAVEIAADLRQSFVYRLNECINFPTASTAIHIVHSAYPLQDAIQQTRAALELAKDSGRDRLCVLLTKGGGERAKGVFRFSSASSESGTAVESLVRLIDWYNTNTISRAIFNDIERESIDLRQARDCDFPLEVRRCVERHVRGDAETRKEMVDQVANELLRVANSAVIRHSTRGNKSDWIDNIIAAGIIAQFISKRGVA